MKKLKKCMADGGKLSIDPIEAALARSRAKYGTADPTPEPPQQNQGQPAEKKPVDQDGQAVMDHIRNRADRLREAMDYEKARKFAGGGVAGVIRDGNSFYSDRAEGAAGAIPSIPGGANPAGVAAFQASVPSMAVGTGATPPSMIPTEAQGLAASGTLAGGNGIGALTTADQSAPGAPTAYGNVFASQSAGNVMAPSGGAQTFAERAQSAGIDQNAAYRPGSAQDPHASGVAGTAQRIAGSNATAAALAPNQQVPQIANPLEMITARHQRQMSRTPGLADGGIPRTRFEGKGGPRDDKIPVTVAGEQIKVSDGEEAVILPAKTAGNPQALAAIGQVIEQSNDGRKPAMGIEAGGKYADGAGNRFASALSANPDDERVAALYGREAERLQGVDVMKVAQAVGGVPEGQRVVMPVQQTPMTSAVADRAIGVHVYPAAQQQPVSSEPQAPDNRPRDRHGNDMTQTLALRDELNRARADNAWSNLNAVNPAYQQKGMAQLQALAGIGALDSEATKRIALRQQQQREADTAALLQEKARGEVADSTAARIAREGLASAYDAGDHAAINNATLKAIAAGVIKAPERHDDYHLSADPLGNQTRLNKVTGAMETLDRATNTLKPVGTASQFPEFASEADARSAQNDGKIKVGQRVMIGGRLFDVKP